MRFFLLKDSRKYWRQFYQVLRKTQAKFVQNLSQHSKKLEKSLVWFTYVYVAKQWKFYYKLNFDQDQFQSIWYLTFI